MENIGKLIRLNVQLLIKSKKSLILLLLGPLLLVSLAVLAFDNVNSYNLNLGIYAESPTDLGHAYITSLKENNFKITRFRSQDSCIDALKTGTTHACIVFKDGPKDEIIFYIDYSKINLVSDLENRMGYQASKRAEELTHNLTETLLQKLDDTRNEIASNRKIIISLTTDNEKITRQINDLASHLIQLNFKLTFDVTNESLSLSESNFLEWLDTMTRKTQEIIQEYRRLATAIEKEVSNSAMSETNKLKILTLLEEGRQELRKLSDNLRISGDITQDDVQELADLVSGVVNRLDVLQEQLDSLVDFRHDGLAQMNSIQRSLDSNLVKYLSLQAVFNNIENNIDDIQISDVDDLNPIRTIIKPVVASKTRFNYVFPVILVIIIMFTGIMLSSTLVILDRESPAHFRNYMTPTKNVTFTFSLFMTSFLLLMGQLLILLTIASFFLGKAIFLNFHNFLFSLSLVVSTFALLGLVLGHLFDSEEASIIAGVSLSSILLIFSDLILPIESMPAYLSTIFQYNPFVISTGILKKILVFELSTPYILGNLLVLGIYIAVLSIILYLVLHLKGRRN